MRRKIFGRFDPSGGTTAFMNQPTLMPSERSEWDQVRAIATRNLKRLPTIVLTPLMVVRLGQYLDAVEIANVFLRERKE